MIIYTGASNFLYSFTCVFLFAFAATDFFLRLQFFDPTSVDAKFKILDMEWFREKAIERGPPFFSPTFVPPVCPLLWFR